MRREDPNQGIPEHVQQRLEEASRERFYAHLLQSIDTLLAESGHDWNWLEEKTGIGDLHYVVGNGYANGQIIVKMGQCFGLEPYLLFRPRTMRACTREGEEYDLHT